jgi:hypothetical protein
MALPAKVEQEVRKMLIRKREEAAIRYAAAWGVEDPEALVQEIQGKIQQEQDADRQRYIDYAREKRLGPYAPHRSA